MPKGIRYTESQKEEMRQRAKKLQAKGKRQKEIAKELGIMIPTLKGLLGESTHAKIQARPAPVLPKTSVAMQLGLKQERLVEVREQQAKLADEARSIEKEIQVLYKKLGEELFSALPKPQRKSK